MLIPVPSVCLSTSDLDDPNIKPIPSTPTEPNTWPSTSSTAAHQVQYRTRSIPKARTSTLSRTSLHYRHHHRNRPSKQFVATTSSDIFGDWDIELKIDHRTLARSKGSHTGMVSTATASSGRGGSRGGASIAVDAGLGVHSGSSGTQPLSTFPLSSSTTPLSPPSSSATTAVASSPALKILKGELPPTPSPANPQNNTSTNTTTIIPTVTSISASQKKQPPWKPGQQIKDANANTTPITTKPAASTAAKKTRGKQEADEIIGDPTPSTATLGPSARSSFLKALGRFKNKHLQQKRSSAFPSSMPAIESSPPVDRRASYVIPPIQFDESNAQAHSSVADMNHESTQYAAPEDSLEILQQQQQPVLPQIEGPGAEGTSSLRVKFKNKVNNTLASMKSSSNLRDRAKAQLLDSFEDPSAQQRTTANERRQSAFFTSSSDTAHQQQQQQCNSNVSNGSASSSGKNRHSKNFWTFPRVRLEVSQPSKQLAFGENSSNNSTSKPESAQDATIHSPELGPADEGSATLHQQLQELRVDEPDSDHSLDIIQPADYEDYTQFAELPLKKRKKMERSLAASEAAHGSNGRPNSMRISTDAMKRFLTKQEAGKNRIADEEGREATEVQSREIGAINSNRKRPQAGSETGESSSKRQGQPASEWRRSLLKSLHLGKGYHPSQKGLNADLSVKKDQPPAALSSVPETDPQVTIAEAARLSRSGSVHSTRSRSLTTSTHPALLATTISKPRSPGLRRETLEMAMRRRRQSSAARSNTSGTEISPPLPLSSEFFNMENISTTNITHTFTSFTLELAEMYARDVVSNSEIPGLFNFKRRTPRLTVSSNIMELDTDQEFKGFDSDGDAISGYTGDADVSMDEFQVRPAKTPTTPTTPFMKARARNSSFSASPSSQRKISSVDGDSDTVPELPTLKIRTRDLNNRNSSGGRGVNGYSRFTRPLSGSSFDMEQDQIDSPRSPRRSGPSSPIRSPRSPMSMEEVVSWKPRNVYSQPRSQVSALDTKPLRPTRGSGVSSSTTLAPSSRTPYSAALTESPGPISPGAGNNEQGSFSRHHLHQQSFSSSSSSTYPKHLHQASGDTLVAGHSHFLSTGSTFSAGSGYSAQTLPGHHQYASLGAQEFDPSDEFPPTTPADLKAMDFEALLATAEREQQKGWEDLMAQKKGYENSALQLSMALPTTTPPPSSFSRPLNVSPLKIANSSRKPQSGLQQQPSQAQRGSVAFDLAPSDDGGTGTGTGTGTGSDRSIRSKRVMKKKMSVIRLAGNGNGNVQGRRENDGFIRVSISPSPYASAPPPPQDVAVGRW
ncbi:hypothetical protein BC939DRAFT_18888 [Gamsiella multidivaricata]|uniref:uncharacterized protein n=1 Tax=Gamsiella multidivaricata TaxID=101098 RepID=UPI002220AA00|nr:uncharacterized protein BC939DRAFT_18888 [Gamsiella multidivaricata]KAI7817102.1 hypothetical protein BC939DRAFT_18888 [Gamsiella multidivaricata]